MMKFIITSTENKKTQPCEKAKKENIPNWDIRYCTEYQYNLFVAKWEGGNWLSKGTDHCVNEAGFIKRKLPAKKWVIDINTVEDLMQIVEERGKIIIMPGGEEHDYMPIIEIYNGWRE